MSKVHLCLEFSRESKFFTDSSSFDAVYKNFFKPLGMLLFSNPGLSFSINFSGTELEALKKKNPEYIELLKTLVSRKQLEVIGGGYYNPVFPLLFPQDRTGQIELLSSLIRQCFGKRPRGLSICGDCWEPSLVKSFESCSMEYVVLDSSLIPQSKQCYRPVIMSDRGTSIAILPSYKALVPGREEAAADFVKRVILSARKVEKTDREYAYGDRVVVIRFSEETIPVLLNAEWTQSLIQEIQKNSAEIALSVPSVAMKLVSTMIPAYITAGLDAGIARWCFAPYEAVEVKDKYPVNIYDFFETYPSSRALYDRMIYVSLLVNQCHGDKARKKSAREFLWASQCGNAYVCNACDPLVNSLEIRKAYKNLTEAEKLVRMSSTFKETVTNYDYNGDGFNEYVCRLEKFNACIGTYGGSVFELDVMKSSGNYADNMERISTFDGINDEYFRGFFVDHLFEADEFKKYAKGLPCRNGQFSGRRYKEVLFSAARHEIQLECKSEFSSMNQPISLRKNYNVTSNGIVVQYIIKNEGPVALKAKLAIESNICETEFLSPDCEPFSIEYVTGGQVQSAESNIASASVSESGLITGVDTVQVTDRMNNVSFMFEPNEDASLVFFPVVFHRRPDNSDELKEAGRTLALSFVWDVDLAGGMEMEKTINLTIAYSRKRRKEQKQ